MAKITACHVPTILQSLAIMSFRKKKKGEPTESLEDLMGQKDNIVIPEGDGLRSSGGLGNVLENSTGTDLAKGLDGDVAIEPSSLGPSLGGSIGGGIDGLAELENDGLLGNLRSNEEVINGLSAQVEDMKGQIETLEIRSQGLSTDMANIKEELSGLNESVKSLLCIYEAVSNQYNPFVDPSKKDPNNAGPSGEAVPGSGSDKKDDLLDLKTPNMRVGSKGQEPDVSPGPRSTVTEAPLPEGSYNADLYCLNQVHKLIDFQLDKIYTRKQKGERVPDAEFEAVIRWLHEMRRMEVK